MLLIVATLNWHIMFLKEFNVEVIDYIHINTEESITVG